MWFLWRMKKMHEFSFMYWMIYFSSVIAYQLPWKHFCYFFCWRNHMFVIIIRDVVNTIAMCLTMWMCMATFKLWQLVKTFIPNCACKNTFGCKLTHWVVINLLKQKNIVYMQTFCFEVGNFAISLLRVYIYFFDFYDFVTKLFRGNFRIIYRRVH